MTRVAVHHMSNPAACEAYLPATPALIDHSVTNLPTAVRYCLTCWTDIRIN